MIRNTQYTERYLRGGGTIEKTGHGGYRLCLVKESRPILTSVVRDLIASGRIRRLDDGTTRVGEVWGAA